MPTSSAGPSPKKESPSTSRSSVTVTSSLNVASKASTLDHRSADVPRDASLSVVEMIFPLESTQTSSPPSPQQVSGSTVVPVIRAWTGPQMSRTAIKNENNLVITFSYGNFRD